MSIKQHTFIILLFSLLHTDAVFSGDNAAEHTKAAEPKIYTAEELIEKAIAQISDFKPSTLKLSLQTENNKLLQPDSSIIVDYLQGSFLKYHRDHEAAASKSRNDLASNEQKIIGHRVTRLLEVLCLQQSLINKNIAQQKLMLQCMLPVFACNKSNSKELKFERGLFDLVLGTEISKNSFDLKIGKNIKTSSKHRVIYLDDESIQRKFDSKNQQLEYEEDFFETSKDAQQENLDAIADVYSLLPATIDVDEQEINFCSETFEIDREAIRLGTFTHEGRKFLIIETENLRYHDAVNCFIESLELLKAYNILGESLKAYTENLGNLKVIDYSKSKSKKGKLSRNASTVKSIIDKTAHVIDEAQYRYAYAIPEEFITKELMCSDTNSFATVAQKLWKKAIVQ